MNLKAIDIDQYGNVRVQNQQDHSETSVHAPVSTSDSPARTVQSPRQRKVDSESMMESGMRIELSSQLQFKYEI